MTTGIAGIGAYTPRFRISAAEIEDALGRFEAGGIDRKAVPEADEDTLTMGYEAATRALDAAGFETDEVDFLAFGTTTPPMAEEDLTARLASFLGISGAVETATLTGSTRAGGQALAVALDAVADEGLGLVVVSDCPRGAPESAIEHAAGAGAVAVVLSPDGPGRVVERASHVRPYPGTRFRGPESDETTGLGITHYDREAFTTVLDEAAAGLETEGVDAAAVQSPDGKRPHRAADALGVDAERIAVAETVDELGDTGAASAFLGLASAVDSGHERVLLATYGSGAGATLFVVDVAGVPSESSFEGYKGLTYPEYLRRRGVIGAEEPDGGGAYVSVPAWQRTIPQRHRLVAGRCPDCGALAFPADGSCADCGSREEFSRVRLPGSGTVEAVTTVEQGGAPPEFAAQQAASGAYASAIVALDGPERNSTVSVPAQVLAPGEEDVAVGTRVATTIRRIYQQEGVTRYGFKMRLVDRNGPSIGVR